MPMVWGVLVVLDQIKSHHIPDICIEDLPIAYRLRSRGNSHFLLFLQLPRIPLFSRPQRMKISGNESSFFVKRDSIAKGFDMPVKCLTSELAPPSVESVLRIKDINRLPESERTFSLSLTSSSQRSSSEMSVPVINLEGFQLDELDSYSGLVQVKQETNPKPAVMSKPTSSKTATAPKPSTTSKSRGPSSRKRKEADSPATSDIFPFENHGFTESSKFMTGFLNQDACGLNKMLESKLKKA
ncbi:hypothetical protein Hanom_Chr07g00601321 [Helianthus anomalus]